jgi:TetR/AcrR family transcriptional repressor of nem operon
MQDLPPKVARKRATAMLATLMGTLVMSRIAGNSEFSDDILSAGREAALACASGAKESSPEVPKGAAKRVAKKRATPKPVAAARR